MLELLEIPDRRQWEKEKSLCSHCDRLVSNRSYFSGSHLRGTCRPAWKIQRENFQWELSNRQPRGRDWRWENPIERTMQTPSPQQEALFEALPERKKRMEEEDPNQLEIFEGGLNYENETI